MTTEMHDTEKKLRAALEQCQKQFQFYAQNHRAKGTAESDEKAVTNDGFAEMCRQVLSFPPISIPDIRVKITDENGEPTVWLMFSTRQHPGAMMLNISSIAKEKGGIIGKILNLWCEDRIKDAGT